MCNMIVTRGRVWNVGGMWKYFPPNCCSFSRVVLAELGLTLLWRRVITSDNLLGLLAFIELLRRSRVSPRRSALAVLPLGNQSISRGPLRSKNMLSAWPYQRWVRRYSSSVGRGDDGCFYCWLMRLVYRSYYKHQDSSPPTVRAKTSSPLSHRSRCSRQISMRVPFCSPFKLFDTHSAETFRHPRTYMMWCTRSTLTPTFLLIHVKRRSHCTWHLCLGP